MEQGMAIRNIVLYPDARLRQAAAPITVFDESVRVLAQDLFDTMCSVSGVGITGPHIGALQRIVILSLPPSDDPAAESTEWQVYLNPEIIESSSDETIQHEEGSISMPGIVEKLVRPAKVRVRYQDLDGQEKIEEAEGFRAVCHQHEIDQLNGMFWIDRLSKLKRERVITRFAKLQRG